MNGIKWLSRVGAKMAIVVWANQLQEMDTRVTVTRIARYLDCSRPTARNLMNEMVEEGWLSKDDFQHRSNVKGYEYRVLVLPESYEWFEKRTLQKMMEYWGTKR